MPEGRPLRGHAAATHFRSQLTEDASGRPAALTSRPDPPHPRGHSGIACARRSSWVSRRSQGRRGTNSARSYRVTEIRAARRLPVFTGRRHASGETAAPDSAQRERTRGIAPWHCRRKSPRSQQGTRRSKAACACRRARRGPRARPDAPDIDGRVYVPEKLKVGEFAEVKITGYHDYDLLALPPAKNRRTGKIGPAGAVTGVGACRVFAESFGCRPASLLAPFARVSPR